MSKAEERALEAYPIPKRKNFVRLEDFASAVKEADKNRINFIKGYEAAQKDLGWISVKDDLPKKKDTYLTYSNEIGLYTTDWKDGKWQDEFGNEVPVDLWMIIPEFPKEI